MKKFIQLTHFSTGDTSFVSVEDIATVSQGFDRSLVLTGKGQGSYYRESAEYIMEAMEADIINRARIMPEPQVCDLGPLPQSEPALWNVVAKWDANFNNDVEINTFKSFKDALETYKAVIADFQDSISGILDVDDCDFSEIDAQLPSVYMVDQSGEDSVRVYIQEVTIL